MTLNDIAAPARGDNPKNFGPTGGLLADPNLYPFENRYVELGDDLVHYVDEGAGPIILFLHAAPAWSFIYRSFISNLRENFRCIALDFPGFGLSPASAAGDPTLGDQSAVVAAFIEALDLRDVVLMVHDSAGPIGLTAACTAPQRYRGLILSDTFAWSLRPYAKVSLMLKLISKTPVALVLAQTALLPWLVTTVGPRRRKLSAAEKAGYTHAFSDVAARRRVLNVFAELSSNEAYLQSLANNLVHLRELPALIMFGEHDPIKSFQQRFEQVFPIHRSVTIAGEGHFPHEGAPQDMIAAIKVFMEVFLSST